MRWRRLGKRENEKTPKKEDLFCLDCFVLYVWKNIQTDFAKIGVFEWEWLFGGLLLLRLFCWMIVLVFVLNKNGQAA